MLIAQITDFHVVERGELLADHVDTASMLRSAVGHLATMRPRPDVVVATGDLVNDGRPAQYDHLMEILDPLPVPLHVVPGNHDDRAELRARFADLPGATSHDGRLDQVIDDHPVRLIGLDTTVPGDHGGVVAADQMRWLDEVLGHEPDRPTLVFQHHPPFTTGITWMDEVGLAPAARLETTIARHDNVLAIVCGHVHRPVVTGFGGTVASCWPSTGAQVALALDGTRYTYVDEPGAVVLHRWDADHGLVTHLDRVTDATTWTPAWARNGV
ncbi:MAG: phosphodiesterase [Ilumatobacteraceae bacterium]